MRKINSISLAVISMCAAALAFSSCQKDEIIGGAEDSRYVQFSVTAETAVDTKAVNNSSELFDLSEEGLDLFVTTSVRVNDANPFVQTKGSIVSLDNPETPGNVDAAEVVKQFNVIMKGAQTKSGIAQPEKSGMDHWALYNGSTKVDWPEDGGEYTFIADFMANANATFTASSMNYVGMAGTKAGDNAAKMADFLLAKTVATHDCKTYHDKSTYVKINFKHALAAVRFNFEGATVTRVMINNVKKDGVVSFEGDAIAWNTSASSLTSYTQDYSASSTVADRTFFIVPQTLGEEATITFEMVDENGKPRSITAQASKLGASSWTAGYIYNYTVSTKATAGEVAIDALNTTVVKNDRSGSAYIRAAVIGNWVDAKNRVVADWDGTLSSNSSWVKIGNYYYTISPVFGFNSSEALMQSLTDGTAHDGLTLKVNMLVQAIAWSEDKSSLTTAWGLTGDDLAKIGLN